jgi:hypothetical protein
MEICLGLDISGLGRIEVAGIENGTAKIRITSRKVEIAALTKRRETILTRPARRAPSAKVAV